jgi:cyclopropane-fatty-acyl-phospholipid synthase
MERALLLAFRGSRRSGAAERLVAMAEGAVGSCPVRFRCWDGSEAGPADAPVMVVRSRRATRRLMFDPSTLGLGRAYVAGDIDVEGELMAVLDAVADIGMQMRDNPTLTLTQRVGLAATAVGLAGFGWRPPAPPEEIRVGGRLHSLSRDKTAVSSHYDVGNDFYREILGPSMVYTCAYWSDDPDCSLEEAQRAKLDLVCRKLRLSDGMRVLDAGCGWGSLAIHAAREYGAQVLAITLSAEQADYARRRVEEEGLAGSVEIRVQDWRDLGEESFDAIASIGMGEHVGRAQYERYVRAMWGMLRPGGVLLNHQIAAEPGLGRSRRRKFIDAFVFPDAEFMPIAQVVDSLENSGFEVRDVHCLREHYDRTLRAWVSNLERNWQQCVEQTSEGRARVWHLYMAACALGFERNVLRINQTLAVRPDKQGRSGIPLVREQWLSAAAPAR